MVNTANFFSDIVIDTRSGRIDNAALHEKLALLLMRVAVTVLRPFHFLGASYAARILRRIIPSKKSIQFILNDDSRMRVDYLDAYWMFLMARNFHYEADVQAFVEAFKDTPYAFIDGGANHGYWSILTSSKQFGSKKSIAIEAASDTFAQLEENCALNNERFVAMNNAIGATSGEHVRIYGVKHEARTIVATEGAKPILDCMSISLDDVANEPSINGAEAYAVKLDVEGMEISSMNAATTLLGGNSVFLYEDHGSDKLHEVTRNAMDNLALRVFWLGDKNALEITNTDQLNAIKVSRRVGYDFAATKSQFWLSRLENLVKTGTAVAA
jgi:FkbM family methyltransferase